MMPEDPSVPPAGKRRSAMMAVFWPSFLVAALAEFAIFAVVDPAALHLPWGETVSRPGAYTIGFFTFWMLGALSSGLTLYFAQAEPRGDAPKEQP